MADYIVGYENAADLARIQQILAEFLSPAFEFLSGIAARFGVRVPTVLPLLPETANLAFGSNFQNTKLFDGKRWLLREFPGAIPCPFAAWSDRRPDSAPPH